jgi:alpha-beta hydrolase superfamily lysophospholipase
MANRTNSLRAIAGNAGKVAHVDVFCNEQDPHSMTENIVRRLVAPKKPLPDTPFVQKVRAAVCAALRRGERVLLAGHSYGGSVATRVAESVDCAGGGTLEVATFGSIYVRSPRAIQPGVRIRHYMYEKNIAAACHRRNVATCSFVNAIPTTLNSVRAHMDYQAFVDEIARTGAITIDIAAVLRKTKTTTTTKNTSPNRRGKKSGFRLPGKGRVQELLDRGIVNVQGGLYGR